MLGMFGLYLFALIPVVIGLIIMIFSKKVNLPEWIGLSVAGLIVAGIMNICAYTGMTSDVEIWSGSVMQVNNYPFYVERYQVSIYRTEHYPSVRTNSDGKMVPCIKSRRVFDHYEWRYRDHNQYFTKQAWFGTESKDFTINEVEYSDLVSKFGPVSTTDGHKTGFYSGDPNLYVCQNANKCVIPVTITKNWSNKVKASPSTFSFQKVPDNAPVFGYPECHDPWRSDRLVGDASTKIETYKFDQMNARLGPTKFVNVIIVGFNSADSNLGKLQEAKWVGGKKNDIVICYGYAPLEGNIPNVCWTYCFSWCQNDVMKRNLEAMFHDNPIDDNILPMVEKEINSGYTLREWSEFDRLTVCPRPIHYGILGGILILVFVVWFVISWFNDICDD